MGSFFDFLFGRKPLQEAAGQVQPVSTYTPGMSIADLAAQAQKQADIAKTQAPQQTGTHYGILARASDLPKPEPKKVPNK